MHGSVVGLGLFLGVVAACGATSSGVQGVSCTQNDNCEVGLLCLPESLPTDGGCTSVGMECLTTCTSDDECNASLGPGFACAKGPCGAGALTCQPFEATEDGGPGGDAAATDAPSAPDSPALDGAHD